MARHKREADGFTQLERKFCHHYILTNGDSSQAYINAGGSKNRRTAATYASVFLKKQHIQNEIKRLTEKALAKLEIKEGDVIKELAYAGFSNIRDYVEWDDRGAHVKASEEVGHDKARAIKSVKITDGRVVDGEGNFIGGDLKVELVLHDKIASLKLLGTNLKMFTHVVEHGGSVQIAQDEASNEAYEKRFGKKKKNARTDS